MRTLGLKALAAVCAVAGLAGCAAEAMRVKADVTRFDSLPGSTAGKTFAILPLEEQKGSAEFRAYADELVVHLAGQGMLEAPPETADYFVFAWYGVGGARTVSGSVPVYGQTGGGTTYSSGTASAYGSGGWGYGTYSGTSYTPPTYGVVGSIPYSTQEYDRYLVLRMVDARRSTPENIVAAYEGQVQSTGSSGSFAKVAPCLFQALFTDFRKPGTDTVIVNMDDGSC